MRAASALSFAMKSVTVPVDRTEVSTAPRGSTLAARNRTNARRSTGPKSTGGKNVARRNAVRHGLTANPAAGVAEDAAVFERLLRGIEDRLRPLDVIESSLCHRIAVAIWRLQRAARVEAAAASRGESGVVPYRAHIQDWTERITDFWKVEVCWDEVPEPDETARRRRKVKRVLIHRPTLHSLDRFRDEQIMADGAAITAMMAMIGELMERLESDRGPLRAEECERLAWLLGVPSEVFPVDSDKSRTPDPEIASWSAWRLIGLAMGREESEARTSARTALRAVADQRVETLRAQRRVCEVPFSIDEWQDRRTVGLLGDDAMLDRIMRYETHADRTLNRALDTLAKLRGATIESIAARVRGVGTDGTAVEVSGQRTRWTPGAALARG